MFMTSNDCGEMQIVLRLFESRAKVSYYGAPKWSRRTQGVPTNWPDRVGAVGRGLLRFGAQSPRVWPSRGKSQIFAFPHNRLIIRIR